jgi:hypothetical protein
MARTYKQVTVFNTRATFLRNLFDPSKEYMGKPVEKPAWLIGVIIQKTRANWFEEPTLTNLTQACQELYNSSMSHIPFAQVIWPIIDGDVAAPGRAQADWRKGHWILNGSSTSPINVTIIQNGIPIPLTDRSRVKPGDYVAVSGAIAVKTNDPRGIKFYCNNAMFTAPGEEIAVGNSVSATDLMAEARAQGLNVTGFGGEGQQGFGQGFAPPPANPAPRTSVADPFGAANTGNAFPSSSAPAPVAPPSQQGFASSGNFNAPTGFPPRQ